MVLSASRICTTTPSAATISKAMPKAAAQPPAMSLILRALQHGLDSLAAGVSEKVAELRELRDFADGVLGAKE